MLGDHIVDAAAGLPVVGAEAAVGVKGPAGATGDGASIAGLRGREGQGRWRSCSVQEGPSHVTGVQASSGAAARRGQK